MMDVPQVRYVAADDGVALAHWTLGSSSRRPLVFVPSAFNRIEFEAAEPRTRAWYDRFARSRRIISYDARGNGSSGRPDGETGYHFDLHLNDLRAIVEALGVDEFDLFGHWQGTQVALEFAAADERVRHLVLWNYQSGDRGQTTPMQALQAIRGAGDSELWARSMSARVLPREETTIARIYERWLLTRVSDDRESDRYIDGFRENRGLDPASEVRCPALILHPNRNGNTEAFNELRGDSVRKLATRLGDCRLVQLSSALTVASLNPPAEIASLVEEFLDEDAVARSTHDTPRPSVASSVAAPRLTARELEVLALVTRAMSNREIAEALTISPGTVGRHVSNILGKLGLKNRTDAARFAAEEGLFDGS